MRILIFGTKGFIGSSIFKNKLMGEQLIELNDINGLSTSVIKEVDVIVNCAGASNISNSFIDTSNDFKKNISLVQEILERIKNSGNKKLRFINLSSAAVYGNPNKLPICESDNQYPISPYGYHKKMAEECCKYYNQFFGIGTLSLRIFSAYGVGQYKMLLWDLHNKIKNSHGNIILFGKGSETRDFIHVEDVFQQLILAINYADFNGQAINIANGKEIEILEVVKLFEKYYPKKFNFQFNGEIRNGDPLNWRADISKMEQFGYKQTVKIENGIENYINWVITK